MSTEAVMLPLFVQVALTFALLSWMAYLRTSALNARAVRDRDIALGEPNWPARTTQVANCFHNQIELPVLFYVLTVLAWITHQADLVFVLMAWVFVVLRLVHAFEHVTTNVVRRRGAIYGAGMIVLIVMWAIFMVRILLGLG
jgi:hypothetical protein